MISANRWYASINDVIKKPNEKGRLSSLIFENKNLQLRYYSPKKKDNQIPHEQDEIYLIAKGSGKFVKNKKEIYFNTGDIILVPKKENHYFKDFTDDFATWVIFYS